MKFSIKVYDCTRGFHVHVYHKKTRVACFGYRGGEFSHDGKNYVLRGPYQRLGDDYMIFELSKVVAPVITTEAAPRCGHISMRRSSHS